MQKGWQDSQARKRITGVQPPANSRGGDSNFPHMVHPVAFRYRSHGLEIHRVTRDSNIVVPPFDSKDYR